MQLFSAPRIDLHPCCGLGQKHGGLQVDPVHLVISFLGDLQQAFLALNADAIHQDIQPAQPLGHRIGGSANGLHGIGVHDQSEGLVPGLPQIRSEGVCFFPVPA